MRTKISSVLMIKTLEMGKFGGFEGFAKFKPF
jgi:hypothetical protein